MRVKKKTEGRVKREYSRIYKELNDTEVAAFERVKARKRRKKKRKRRLVLTAICVCMLFTIYLFSPISRVQSVHVYQNKMVDTESILQESRIKEGKSFMVLLLDYFIAKNVQNNPFINDVHIDKKLNGTINLTVSERWVVYKRKKEDQWIAYFSDGTSAVIPPSYDVNATVLVSVADEDTFPYDELAKNLGYVPREIVDEISEIKHNPSNLEDLRFMFYMNDRNRVSILMDNIKGMMKYYDKLIENSNHERFEYVMEYTKRGIIGRKLNDE